MSRLVPASRELLDRAMGGSPKREFLEKLAGRDVVNISDECWTLSPLLATTASTGGTVFAAVSGSAVGEIQGGTAATANTVVQVSTGAIVVPARNPTVELVVKVDPITSVVLEAGLQEPQTDELTMAVTNYTTPALGAGITDAALFAWSTANANGGAFTKGSATGQGTVRTVIASPIAVGTYVTLGIRLLGSAAEFYVNGNLRAVHDTRVNNGNSAVNPNVALKVVVRGQTLGAAIRTVTVDAIRLWQDR